MLITGVPQDVVDSELPLARGVCGEKRRDE
jgi:hypothetical protein